DQGLQPECEGQHRAGRPRRGHRLARHGGCGTMTRQELQGIEKRMADAVGHLKDRLKTLRTGRANLAILDGVLVSAYGTDVPINQVANLSVPEPTLIVAAPWDPKMAAEIERAIRKSDLGLNPQSDGKVVRLPIPQPTEERRKELAKKAHHMAEEA